MPSTCTSWNSWSSVPAVLNYYQPMYQQLLYFFFLCSTSGTWLKNNGSSLSPNHWKQGNAHHPPFISPWWLLPLPLTLGILRCFVRERHKTYVLIALKCWDKNPAQFVLTRKAHCVQLRGTSTSETGFIMIHSSILVLTSSPVTSAHKWT